MSLRRRLLVSLVLAVPVVVPAAQFRYWQWVSLALALPVAVWGAWPFHRAAFRNAGHGTVTMDTLISVGVGAAYLWSAYQLFFGTAGQADMHISFALPTTGAGAIYLDVASGGDRTDPAGPLSRGSRQAPGSGGAAGAAIAGRQGCRGAARRPRDADPASQLGVGDVFVVRPGEKIATDGMVESGASAVDASIVLDKTGTITTGRMSLAGVAAVPGKDPAQVTSGQRMPGRWSMMGANPIRHGNC